MLQMQIKTVDVCRISKILEKYNVKASIVNPTIIWEGDISDEFLDRLTSNIEICSVQNFVSELSSEICTRDTSNQNQSASTQICTETSLEVMKEESNDEHIDQAFSIQPVEKYDLIYSEVKRGEVYMCDFGKPYGSEQGFCRYAIIVQNDNGNKHSPTTIVIACTTEHKKILPVHLSCVFSVDNMIIYEKVW